MCGLISGGDYIREEGEWGVVRGGELFWRMIMMRGWNFCEVGFVFVFDTETTGIPRNYKATVKQSGELAAGGAVGVFADGR